MRHSQRITSTGVAAGDSENFSFHVSVPEDAAAPSVLLGSLVAVKYTIEVEARVSRAINLMLSFPFQFVARTQRNETLAECVLPQTAPHTANTTADTNDEDGLEEMPRQPAAPVQRTVTDSSLHDLNDATLLTSTSVPLSTSDNEQLLQLLPPSSPTPPASPQASSAAAATSASIGSSSLRNVAQTAESFSLQTDEDDDESDEIVLEMSTV